MLAESVQKVLNGKLNPVRPPIRTDYTVVDLDFPPFNLEMYEKDIISSNQSLQKRANLMLEAYNKGWDVSHYPYPVQAVRFNNDLTILALSGEIVVDYSLRAKKEYPDENMFVAGYCNEVMCYIPSRRVLDEGGYEADRSMIGYGFPGPFANNVEDKVFSAIHRVMSVTGARSTNQVTAQKKIFIVTDLEGASGVYKFLQTREKDTPLNIQACEYLMGDVNAVVRGLRDGGATEIIILDGHGSQTVIPHLIEPGAKHITGAGKPASGGPLWGLDKSYAGFVQIAAHAMMGTPDGVLNHTQSSKSENRYWYNGVESGEIAQAAAIAGYYGVPTIMVSGDKAVCREARNFFGESCVTVAVKEGISREAAILYPFEETRRALYEGAKRAMTVISECKPYLLEKPIKVKKQYLDLDPKLPKPNLVTKEGTIPDALHMYEF